MPEIKVIIVDDEKEAREGIAMLLEKDPEISIVALCKNGLEAIKAVQEQQPELIFLDIQMPTINGFEVLSTLSETNLPEVIFVTAYEQYLLKAFENHAVDYLLKPFTDDRLIIKADGKIYFVPLQDIIWIQAYDYYVRVHVNARFYLIRESLKKMEQLLPDEIFLRVHKSSIINLHHVKEIELYFTNEFIAKMSNGEKIKTSRNYRDTLNDMI
jgi:two-component system LytT family response regulator